MSEGGGGGDGTWVEWILGVEGAVDHLASGGERPVGLARVHDTRVLPQMGCGPFVDDGA